MEIKTKHKITNNILQTAGNHNNHFRTELFCGVTPPSHHREKPVCMHNGRTKQTNKQTSKHLQLAGKSRRQGVVLLWGETRAERVHRLLEEGDPRRVGDVAHPGFGLKPPGGGGATLFAQPAQDTQNSDGTRTFSKKILPETHPQTSDHGPAITSPPGGQGSSVLKTKKKPEPVSLKCMRGIARATRRPHFSTSRSASRNRSCVAASSLGTAAHGGNPPWDHSNQAKALTGRLLLARLLLGGRLARAHPSTGRGGNPSGNFVQLFVRPPRTPPPKPQGPPTQSPAHVTNPGQDSK